MRIGGLFLGWFVFGVCATAQTIPSLHLKFVVFANGLPKEVMYVPEPDQEPVALRFLSSQRSRVYEYEGPNPLVFFTEVEVPPDPARPNAPRIQRVPVGYVSIPVGMREAFILFTPDGKWGPNTIPRYIVSIFDDSLASFPKDHAVFLNATGAPLSGRVGGREIGVPNGLSEPVNIGEGETAVQLSTLRSGERINVYSDRIPLGRDQRVTVVLLPPYREDVQQLQRRFLYDPDKRPVIKRPVTEEGTPQGTR